MNTVVKVDKCYVHINEFKELVLNAEYQVNRIYTIRKSEEKHQARVYRTMARVLNIISERYNPDFEKSPYDFFTNNFENNNKDFYDFMKKNYTRKVFGVLLTGYKFIVDEVIPRRNTAQWIDLEESRSLFPTDLHPQDRLIYCLNRIVENQNPLITQDSPVHKRAKILISVFNEYCGDVKGLWGINSLTRILKKTTYPIFVPDNEFESFAEQFYKGGVPYRPVSVLVATEELSLAPKGYLLDVIKLKEKRQRYQGLNGTPLKFKRKTKRPAPSREPFDIKYITEDFKNEVHLLYKYRTTPILDKKRSSTWVVRTSEREIPEKDKNRNLFNPKTLADLSIVERGKYVPTLDVYVKFFIEIMHHCVKNKIISPEKLSVFNICEPQISVDYINSIIEKKGTVTISAVRLIACVKTLWNPENSFFYEYADEYFCEKYSISKDELLEKCTFNFEFLKSSLPQIEEHVRLSEYSTKITNAAITDLNVPINYVLDMLKKAKEDLGDRLNVDKIRMTDFTLFRFIVLTSCLTCVPLRLRNWVDMRFGYFDPNNECIFEKNGVWELSVPKKAFKNYRQKHIPEHFKYTFDEEVSKLLDEYARIREKAIPHVKPYLLTTFREGNPIADTTVATQFSLFTRIYGDASLAKGGINIHFMRDIVATTFLKKHKGAFAYVAYLLLDSEETVRLHYGHLSPNDAFYDWNSYVNSLKYETI
jgi:hypothetical protein